MLQRRTSCPSEAVRWTWILVMISRACPPEEERRIRTKEAYDGYQAKRLAALGEGPGRLVYRHRPYRPFVRSERSGASGRQRRHVRARRAHRMAHASTRANAD